jgi:hypothetical protein
LSDRDKERISFVEEMFSLKYIKRDFGPFLKERKEDPLTFWVIFAVIAVNFLAIILLFASYIVHVLF